MKSEAEIRKLYERKLRLYAVTGRDRFLYQTEVLKDVLEIDEQEEIDLLSKYIKENRDEHEIRIT